MPANVSAIPITLGRTAVVSGLRVSGTTWEAIANQYNHIMGMSTALVPHTALDITVAAAATGTARFYCHPRFQCTHRIWFVCIGTASGFADVDVTLPNGDAYALRAIADPAANCVALIETLLGGDQTDTAGELAVTFANDASSTGSAVVRTAACFELRRVDLSTDDGGVLAETLRAGLPIYDGSASRQSLGGVASLIDTLLDTARRPGFFHASPFAASTSGSFANPFGDSFACLARKLYRTSTTGVMQVHAYCRTPVGTVGEVKFTMTSGDFVTLTIPSGTTGWVSGEVDIDCDDFADDYGRRATRDDECTVEFRRVSGAGTVNFDHVSAGEKHA